MASEQLQLRGGTADEHDVTNGGFTGASKEVTVDTTNNRLRLHDGSTVGGHVLANISDVYTQTELNDGQLDTRYYTETEIDTNHYTKSATYNKIEIDTKINALAPYSGYTKVSKKLDNFVFQTSSNFTYKVADKNRFIKFGDKVVDTYGEELATTALSSVTDNGNVTYIDKNDTFIHFKTSGDGRIYIPVSIVAGKQYTVEISMINKSSTYLRVDMSDTDGVGALDGNNDFINKTKSGFYSGTFLAVSSGTKFLWIRTDVAGEFVVSNISVKEIQTADFSETMPDVVEVITDGSNTTGVAVSAGEYVVVDKPNLLIGDNSTFDTTVGDWIGNNAATVAVVSNRLEVTTNGATGDAKISTVGVTTGKVYTVIFDAIAGTAGGDIRVNGSSIGVTSGTRLARTFTASFNTLLLGVTGNGTVYFDNIVLFEGDVSDTFRATRDTADMYDYDDTVSFETTINNIVVKCTGANTTGVSGNYYLKVSTTNINPSATNLTNTSNWKDLGTASAMSLENPYFEDRTQMGITNQVLSYHAYNTLTSTYEGIKTEVLFSDVSKEQLLDNSAWMANNGFSKVSQFLYSKNNYLCLPVEIRQC